MIDFSRHNVFSKKSFIKNLFIKIFNFFDLLFLIVLKRNN